MKLNKFFWIIAFIFVLYAAIGSQIAFRFNGLSPIYFIIGYVGCVAFGYEVIK